MDSVYLFTNVIFQEQEARTNALRVKARAVYDGRQEDTSTEAEKQASSTTEHINFFKELEEGLVTFTGTNKDYEREKKEEKEKYEKQIGYLTYLGQDTVEATGNISWYNKVPNRLQDEKKKENVKEKEVNEKSKKLIDPLNSIRRYLGMTSTTKVSEVKKASQTKHEVYDKEKSKKKMKKKRNRDKSSSDEESYKHKRKKTKHSHLKNSVLNKKHKKKSFRESNDHDKQTKVDINVLRAERLKREKEERLKAARALAKLRGQSLPEDKPKQIVPEIRQKYSSQFNPQLARQNFDHDRR